MELTSRILVTGTNGLIGSNIITVLREQKYENVFEHKGRQDFDLLDVRKTEEFFNEYKFDYVLMVLEYSKVLMMHVIKVVLKR